MARAEPEFELIRRISPFALPVAILAYIVGALVAGAGAGWSAAIAVVVVYLNFVAHGWSLAKAAAISPVLLYAVGLSGFVIRLGIIIALMALLRQFAWFSTIAFIAALVPATIALLVAEMKMLSGRLQVDMWSFPASGPAAGQVPR